MSYLTNALSQERPEFRVAENFLESDGAEPRLNALAAAQVNPYGWDRARPQTPLKPKADYSLEGMFDWWNTPILPGQRGGVFPSGTDIYGREVTAAPEPFVNALAGAQNIGDSMSAAGRGEMGRSYTDDEFNVASGQMMDLAGMAALGTAPAQYATMPANSVGMFGGRMGKKTNQPTKPVAELAESEAVPMANDAKAMNALSRDLELVDINDAPGTRKPSRRRTLADGSDVYVKDANDPRQAAVEVLATNLANAIEPTTPRSRLVKLPNDRYGVAVDYIDGHAPYTEGNGSLLDGSISADNVPRIVRQAAIDTWLLNADSNWTNFMVDNTGIIRGIDKEYPFKGDLYSPFSDVGNEVGIKRTKIMKDRFSMVRDVVDAIEKQKKSGSRQLADTWNETIQQIKNIPRPVVENLMERVSGNGSLSNVEIDAIRNVIASDEGMRLFANNPTAGLAEILGQEREANGLSRALSRDIDPLGYYSQAVPESTNALGRR